MRFSFSFAVLLIGLGSFSARSETFYHSGGWETCACKRHLGKLVPFDPDADHIGNGRKYARDREIDVHHVKLELDPDFAARTLSGIATTTFAPIAKPLQELRLDAVDLNVESVEASNPIEVWNVGDSAITITFVDPIDPDTEAWVKVTYHAEPRDGWFYRTEAMGYPAGDDHFWTQGEPERHRHWFPGYDFPNERFTSEVVCRVPTGMTVLSNGRLVEEREDGDESVFHWSQEKEHVNYLISVVGGHFDKLESNHGDLPLAFLTPPSEFAVAENSFRDTADILAFLEEEIGVKFPWAKYYNICVSDFIAGGMENTSLTTLTTLTLFSDESENLRSSHRLDAHEVTHQWFGDLLTCKDWSHLWLNEGFATYYTHLYEEEKNGTDDMRYGLWRDAEKILANKDEKPIVWREFDDPMEQFDYRAYPKGSWVLHMLRSQLGDDLFRKCITAYVERNRNRNVITQDLVTVFEELSGRSWDEFFDQWVYHGGEPELKVAYAWDQARKQAKLSVSQTQKVSDKVLLFDFPLPLRFIDENDVVHDFTVRIHEKSEDFFFELPTKAKIVRIDPELTVLAKIDFKPPNPLLFAQLENAEDPIGRIHAVETLGGKSDKQSIEKLKNALSNDSFFGVRIAAAKALAKTHSPAALAALVDSREQPDARARKEVVGSIAKFYNDTAFEALVEVAENEANPEIAADALVALGKFPKDSVHPILLAALDRESYRHRLAGSAIQSLRVQASPDSVSTILEHLENNESDFTTRDFGQALDALAYLSRNQEPEDREKSRLFIAGYLDHPKEGLRRDAISALGTLEDTRSLGALRTFIESGNSDLPEYKAAESAIQKLSNEKGQADEVKDLRKEMLDLQKKLTDLDKNLETLKKQTTPEEKKSNNPMNEPNTLFIEVSGAGLPEVDGLFVPSTAPPAESESGTVSTPGYWNGKMAWDRADGESARSPALSYSNSYRSWRICRLDGHLAYDITSEDALPPTDREWHVYKKGVAPAPQVTLHHFDPRLPCPAPNVVFVLGGPGAGKGTMCELAESQLGWTHLSTGDLLRNEYEIGGEAAATIEDCFTAGKLVPNEIIVSLLKNAMETITRTTGRRNFLLDGFPRSLDNLEGWREIFGEETDLPKMIYFECPYLVLEQRILARAKYTERTDDNVESVKLRFDTFKAETLPIVEQFESEGKCVKIDTGQDRETVYQFFSENLAEYTDDALASRPLTERAEILLGLRPYPADES